MPKTLRIASWNIEGRLSETTNKKRGNPDHIIQSIKKLNADILVLLEAHGENSLDNLNSKQQLIDMGYKIFDIPYQDDTPSRTDTSAELLSILLLSKLPIDHFRNIRLADMRNAFTAIVKNHYEIFRIMGVHLDDRSEATRIHQVADLSEIINQSKLPTVVVGDYNAMHGEDLMPSKLLRSRPVKLISKFILPSIAVRATEMARGEALKLLQASTGLSDADIHHRPTTTPKMRDLEWLPSVRLIQIDHIFVSSGIKVKDFQIAPDGGADHRAIIADLIIPIK